MNYTLIFVCSGHEFLSPVVESQLVKQAYLQQTISGNNSPRKVELWVLVGFRFVFEREYVRKLRTLRRRFPGLKIRLVPGIGILRNFPSQILMTTNRILLGKRAIFHLRGYGEAKRIEKVKRLFQNDRILVDIRGVWPAEKLLEEGIETFELDQLYQHKISVDLIEDMYDSLKMADGVCAVTEGMLSWVLSSTQLGVKSWTVPCCTSIVFKDSSSIITRRNHARKLIGFHASDIVFGYLGGSSKYQGLEEYLLPIMRELIRKADNIHFLVVSHDAEKIRMLVQEQRLLEDRIKFISVSQEEVSTMLSAIDMGFLIRRNNLVNRLAYPVKLGEYLSSGVPVCMSSEIAGNLGFELQSSNAGIQVDVEHFNPIEISARCLAFIDSYSKTTRIGNAINFVQNSCSWDMGIGLHRINYQSLLD